MATATTTRRNVSTRRPATRKGKHAKPSWVETVDRATEWPLSPVPRRYASAEEIAGWVRLAKSTRQAARILAKQPAAVNRIVNRCREEADAMPGHDGVDATSFVSAALANHLRKTGHDVEPGYILFHTIANAMLETLPEATP